MSRPFKILLITLMLISLFITDFVMAGITGKISGRVVDRNTGEPLAGANIIIEGTNMGAASNLNGEYTILRVPPGIYTVTAIYIGYAKLSVDKVRVRIDQTSNINFSLTLAAVKGEHVTVQAERKVVKKDVTTSVSVISGNDVKQLPMDNVENIIGLQAGVEEGLSIRGGGADQALFQINGITMRDPRNNLPITGVALSAIQEVSVERGGFNAEYGQVRSGIINVVTKEGGRTYEGTITLKAAPPAKKYFGISPYDPNSMWLRPYLDDAVCWTGTQNGAWDKYQQRQYPKFDGWNAISRQLFEDSDPTNDLTPIAAQRLFKWQHRKQEINDQPDYNIDAGFGGPVPVIGKNLGIFVFTHHFAVIERCTCILLHDRI